MRSFRRSKYRGHLWTIVSSQSRSLSLPQRGSASCCTMNDEKAVFVDRRVVIDDITAGNEVTNGLYSER